MADADELGARLRFALDLFEAGCDLCRQRIRRENPAMSTEEVEALVDAWIRDRPGAPYGDAPGRRRTLAPSK